MAKYRDLLNDYFTGSLENDANKKAQSIEKMSELLEAESEGSFSLYEDLSNYLIENNSDKNKELVIELFNDINQYVEINEHKFTKAKLSYSHVLYRYQKLNMADLETYLSKLSEQNRYLLLYNPMMTIGSRLKQMQEIQFKPERWDKLYSYFFNFTKYFSADEKKDMLSFLETKASKGVILTQAANKELIRETWTEESLNHYIQ